jgi:heme A synthase
VPAFAVVAAGTAAVTYASFVLESLLSPDPDVVNGYVSELSASDQPNHLVYNVGDFVTGALVIIAAAAALVTSCRRPWAVAGWIFLLMFGVATIGDAAFPLDCAPSENTACALRERAGQVSFSHQFHSVTSASAITCATVALYVLSIAARRYGWWPSLARWGRPLAGANVLAAIAVTTLMTVGVWLGLAQRLQIIILCLNLVLVAWALHADRRARPAGPEDQETNDERTYPSEPPEPPPGTMRCNREGRGGGWN